MLFLISWKISAANRVSCWNVFGNMTPEDDLKDAGPHIKIVGRWHHLSGDGGVCICDTDDSAALNSFMLNWSPICDITVNPVVDDASARASIQTKPYFQAKAAGEDAASGDGATKSDSAQDKVNNQPACCKTGCNII